MKTLIDIMLNIAWALLIIAGFLAGVYLVLMIMDRRLKSKSDGREQEVLMRMLYSAGTGNKKVQPEAPSEQDGAAPAEQRLPD